MHYNDANVTRKHTRKYKILKQHEMQEYTTNKHQKIGEREAKATVITQYKTNSTINKIRIFANTYKTSG